MESSCFTHPYVVSLMVNARLFQVLRNRLMPILDLRLRGFIAQHLHPRLRQAASRLLDRFHIWRVGIVATRLLGPQFHRSRRRIELNITFACNLRCVNCDRSCEQAPTSMKMSLQQVTCFIEETVAAGYEWDD